MLLAALLTISFPICPPSGVRITCVHDGDSFIIERERIRIADIDTPELNGQCEDERRRAILARDRLRELLNAGAIEVRRQGKDRNGRTLALILRDGRSVGLQLVEEGHARRWEGRRRSWCG